MIHAIRFLQTRVQHGFSPPRCGGGRPRTGIVDAPFNHRGAARHQLAPPDAMKQTPP
jgi:hypothetical protein